MSETALITTTPVGLVEWFQPGERERVERVLETLRGLGVRHLRTGLSWADWHAPGGREWYGWLLPRLGREVRVLPCAVYTPPSLSLADKAAAPPRRPRDFADFLDTAIDLYGDWFDEVELWNEPNNIAEWDWRLDPSWERFAEMIAAAAHWVRERGKRSVLGGMSPLDPNWLALMGERGVLEHLDVIGIHGFPGTWEIEWRGWAPVVAAVQAVCRRFGAEPEVWITEAGFSTWRHDEWSQLRELVSVLDAPVSRAYWYSVEDLEPDRSTVGGFHTDMRHYHMGLVTHEGRPKLLARLWKAHGLDGVRETVALAERRPRRVARRRPLALVTGGAGFVGTNLVSRLVEDGRRVRVLDNLSRPGVEENLRRLVAGHGARVEVDAGDVRDPVAVRRAARDADDVFHLAAQVAVTTSLVDPGHDFDVNVRGTVHLLEELRRRDDPPFLLFTSTNKVYGALRDLDPRLLATGIGEAQPFDPCTPYGCSKGAADRYVLDYAKSFGLPAVVFRMSCVYGPHQHGNEDQGWVAHFLLRALRGEPITIFGDGAQVRDVLHVSDLVEAMMLARANVGRLAGRALNVGGGPENAVGLLEVVELIEAASGRRPRLRFAEERPGDQRWYVSDVSAIGDELGWAPSVAPADGVAALHEWLSGRVGVRA